MLQSLLSVAMAALDLIIRDQAKRAEWKRKVAAALEAEARADDSARARRDYEEAQARARDAQ